MELFKVMSVEETKELLKKTFMKKGQCEEIALSDALGRIIYEDITAKENVPAFRRSTVDGYAVASKDVVGASETIPSMMNLIGEVIMGQAPSISLKFPGECAYVPTGGMLPEGTDSTVMVEYTDKLDEDTILINTSIAYGDNVVDIGEDIAIDELIIKKGTKLRPYEIGVLSSLGIGKVSVYEKPKVAIISTGDEIVGCDDTPKLGEVRDINSYMLYTAVLEDGGYPINFGVVKDDFSGLKTLMEKALEQCDVVLISGGSSVGKKDQSLRVLNSLDSSTVLVHGIAVKPGKPTIIGKVGEKAVFGLPGHPLSCAVVYKIIVKDYLNDLCCFDEKVYGIQCEFEMNYHKAKGREEYLPVIIKEENHNLIASPILSKSGVITGFSKAWGYIKIEKNQEGILQGQRVYVYKF
jgi:molybdopterin molybdotransferase